MTTLHHLNLSSNHFKGGIAPNLGSMASLCTVDLSMNQLSGAIPFDPAKQLLLRRVVLFGNDDLIAADMWRREDTAR